ncbi:prosaposin isoform X2 [Neltuma alba]|nr:prosaposin-like isoform X2 [Prosopis alba]XP_028768297.1 prosaposin-like isoform X2 [Prosopis alba]
MGILFLVILGAAWACHARELANTDLLSEQTRKPDVCTLCEEYSAKALEYLKENKTQGEIMDYLHNTCHQLQSFEQQCTSLVDYYAPLFFLELESIQPEEFCEKVNLCEKIAIISSKVQQDSCGFCKEAVSELMDKLEDPDTQLEIIEAFLKVCNSMEKYSRKCKKLVFEYGPVILMNAEKFLETKDICTVIHACKAATEEIPLLSDS